MTGHDGTETTRGGVRAGQGEDPSLPWHTQGWAAAEEPRAGAAPKRRRGSAPAAPGDTVADGDVMQQ